MSTTTVAPKAPKKLAATDIIVGDVFSEMSHYTYKGKGPQGLFFTHHGSGQQVELAANYVEKFLHTANQHQAEVEVGKEDKLWTAKQIAEAKFSTGDIPKEGDVRVPGIRTLWENIHSAQVFQVCFQKQGKPLSIKALADLKEAQVTAALAKLEKAKTGKTGVTKAAIEVLKDIQDNPITPYEEGELRVLTGYKIQFTSRDGKYNCIDMLLTAPNNVRPVNINTLEWLIFDGVKYIVK